MPPFRHSLPLLRGLLLLAACAFTSSLSAALDDATQKMLETGDLDGAKVRLESTLKESPAHVEARNTLAALLAYSGDRAAAIEVLEAGVAIEPRTIAWWGQMAELAQQLAEDGPAMIRQGDMVSFDPSKALPEDEAAAFAARYFAKAFEAYAKVLEINPMVEPGLRGLAAVAEGAGEQAQAIPLLAKAIDAPEVNQAWLQGAIAHMHLALGENETARRHALLAMESDQGSAAAAAVLAQLAEAEGDDALAQSWRDQQAFLALRPAFLTLPFNAENLATLRLLAMTMTPEMETVQSEIDALLDGEPTSEVEENAFDEQLEHLEETLSDLRNDQQQEMQAAVEKLLTTLTNESSQLLAALAYYHVAHGEIEDSAFAALGERGEIDLVKSMLSNAGTVCTMKGCAQALVSAEDPEAVQLIAPLLSMDTGMWPIHAGQALGELGDLAAVPHLAAIAFEPPPPKSEDNFMAGFGFGRRRTECIHALGRLDCPAAREALAELEGSSDTEIDATLALLRLDPTKKRWKRIHRWAKREDSAYDLIEAVEYLADLEFPEDNAKLRALALRRFPEEAARLANRAD